MAGKKGGGDNSKKAAGQARKAETAAKKAAAEGAKKTAVEETKWDEGSKKANAKKEADAAKKEEAARKKAEREALLAEEEKSTPGRSEPKKSKTAQKKTRGLDLSQLGDDGPLSTLNATGIDNALDALDITSSDNKVKLDRHPEKRKKAAWKAFEGRGIQQAREEGWFKIKGNSFQRKVELLREEFESSPENPMNQVHASYNMTQEVLKEIRDGQKKEVEQRLGSK